MVGVRPFPFETLSQASCRLNREGKADGSSVVRDPADDRRAIFSPFGKTSREPCEPEHQYTADDLARAVDEAKKAIVPEVEARLRSEFEASLEQRRCDLLAAIREQLELHRSGFDSKLINLAEVAQSLAVALAKAVVPRAIEREPLVDIADMLKGVLARLVEEPSLELRLPPDLVEEGTRILTEVVREVGFGGDVMTTADSSLRKGDALICWNGGLADRRLDRLQAEAQDLVDRWLPARANVAGNDDDSLPPRTEATQDVPCNATEQFDGKTVMSEQIHEH